MISTKEQIGLFTLKMIAWRIFDGEHYVEIIKGVIEEEHPIITLIGHTPWGMDFAPSLSIKTGYPLVSDCVDVFVEEDEPKVIRQIYGGKLLSKVGFKKSEGYILTIRPGAFPGDNIEEHQAEVVKRITQLAFRRHVYSLWSSWIQESGRWISPWQIFWCPYFIFTIKIDG